MAELRRCSVLGCGRKVQASGLCQTHRKQLRKLGAVKAIRLYRPAREGTVRLSGVTVTRDCADKVNRYAEDSALTVNAAVTNIIEEWAARKAARQTRAELKIPRGRSPWGAGGEPTGGARFGPSLMGARSGRLQRGGKASRVGPVDSFPRG